MKTIKIIDCNKREQNLNVVFNYNISSFTPGFLQLTEPDIFLHYVCED